MENGQLIRGMVSRYHMSKDPLSTAENIKRSLAVIVDGGSVDPDIIGDFGWHDTAGYFGWTGMIPRLGGHVDLHGGMIFRLV